MLEIFQAFFDPVKEFWSSNQGLFRELIAPLFIASFAAYFGAVTAQKVSARRDTTRILLAESQEAMNAAVVSAITANAMISLKKQQLQPLLEEYFSEKAEFRRKMVSPPPDKKIFIRYNLLSIDGTSLETENLLERLTRFTCPASIIFEAAALVQATKNVNDLLKLRNSWVQDFAGSSIPEPEAASRYFGLQHGATKDETYSNIMDGLQISTNDAIAHGIILNVRLSILALEFREKLPARLFDSCIPLEVADFNDSKAQGLVPNLDDYADWFKIPAIRRSYFLWGKRKKLYDARTKIVANLD